ncbi:MAG: ferritin-like domain-containing protein [Actinomycetota bacterium]|nr:ferritin-like domain-containing protein [Actinomycetota bacterium]
MPGADPLRDELLERLRALHALKAGALRLLDPMLGSVAAAREDGALSEVSDLLGRMHGAFSGHRATTARHVADLAARIDALGGSTSRGRVQAVGAGAALRGRLAARGGMNFGAAASEAFVFEHLEIAQTHLIEELARRIGDEATADLAAGIRGQDEGMAETIGRNWTNVLSLALATKGLPTLRLPEEAS